MLLLRGFYEILENKQEYMKSEPFFHRLKKLSALKLKQRKSVAESVMWRQQHPPAPAPVTETLLLAYCISTIATFLQSDLTFRQIQILIRAFPVNLALSHSHMYSRILIIHFLFISYGTGRGRRIGPRNLCLFGRSFGEKG